jgi:hypothetical protein
LSRYPYQLRTCNLKWFLLWRCLLLVVDRALLTGQAVVDLPGFCGLGHAVVEDGPPAPWTDGQQVIGPPHIDLSPLHVAGVFCAPDHLIA